MVFLAVWVVGAFAAEEVGEVEGNASGVVDGFHVWEDRLADLTFELLVDDVADGGARGGGQYVSTWARCGVALVFLLFLCGFVGGRSVFRVVFCVNAYTFWGAEEVVDDGGARLAECDREGVGEVGDVAEVLGGVVAPLGEVDVIVGGKGGVGDG